MTNGEIAAFESNTLQRLASLESHVNTLVMANAADTAWKSNHEQTMHTMQRIVSEHYRELIGKIGSAQKSETDALRDKLDLIQAALGVPCQHVGDERVNEVDAIHRLQDRLAKYEKDHADAAGELRVSVEDCAPGTLCGKLLSANVLLRHSNSDLLSRAAVLMAERDDISAKLSEARRVLAVSMLTKEHDMQMRMVMDKLADANACIKGREEDARKLANECDRMEAERDKALSDLAAARESEDRFRGEVAAAFRKHGLAAGPDVVDGLVRDLSAMKEQLERSMLAASETQDALKRECAEHNATKGALDAMKERADLYENACCDAGWNAGPLQDFVHHWKERAEKLERRIELFKNECSYAHKERNATNASLRESRAEADALRTQLSGSMAAAKKDVDALRAELHATKLSVSEWHADSERLSLEVAALKARNALLEEVYKNAAALATGQDWNNGTMAKTHGYRNKLVRALQDVDAAGVEVV